MPKEIITFEKWADEFTTMITAETYKLLDAQTTRKGTKASRYVLAQFLSKFIGMAVYMSLTEEVKGSKDQQFKLAKDNFADMKVKIQEAVSTGFSAAMMLFANKDIEYYCRVTPVPPPANKRMI
jgi:hypothetical protein